MIKFPLKRTLLTEAAVWFLSAASIKREEKRKALDTSSAATKYSMLPLLIPLALTPTFPAGC